MRMYIRKRVITLAYKELIGKFNEIRDYMREFYVFGFKSRGEVGCKSSRTYDNYLRKIKSWLGEYMSYTRSAAGNAQFISVDGREMIHNPLYEAFKTCLFTDYDILFHFCLLDFMTSDEWMSLNSIADTLQKKYFDLMKVEITPEARTLEKKINDYVKLGIFDLMKVKITPEVCSLEKFTVEKKDDYVKLGIIEETNKNEETNKKKRYKNFYRLLCKDIDLQSWKDAIEFFSEVNQIGVIGSYILDRKELSKQQSSFWFKHHYILYSIDSEILEVLLEAISEKKYVEITTIGKKKKIKKVYPIKIYVSTQNGRVYLAYYENRNEVISFIRLDNIQYVGIKEKCNLCSKYKEQYNKSKQYLWGVTSGKAKDVSHVEMTIFVGKEEEFILRRLEREKRNGNIEKISDTEYKYVVDTYDAMEMMPWIRSFIGRIVKIESSNPNLERKLIEDIEALYLMYFGGEGNDI